ncbi:MAG: GTP-binding protein [Johnsonella sp.]|nr:GTP-binding protein [Johnsonella sp.]
MKNNSKERIPLFLINGFLEAGKTQFIKFTMQQEYFQTSGKTLLIVCEEGEEEYEESLLAAHNTEALYIESREEIGPKALEELCRKHEPERIIIEWNGMWMQDELKLPYCIFLNQTITIFDTSTMELYLNNMKPFMGPMLKNAELIICNRADDIGEEILGKHYLALKAMAGEAEIVFEGEEGEIRGDFCIQTPYDLNEEKIRLEAKDFGIFYVDSMDRPDRYEGKEIEFTAQILRPPGIPADCMVPGRRVMTCCEDDVQFLGFICFYKGASRFKNGDWLKIKAKIKSEENKQYGRKGPVLYAYEAALTGAIKEIVRF